MTRPVVSRDAFRGFFALYAVKAHRYHKHGGEDHVLQLFGSSNDIPDNLLEQWSDRAEVLGPENVFNVLGPRIRDVADGKANYDHASAFLHALLRELDDGKLGDGGADKV